jgi:hypothetical protein
VQYPFSTENTVVGGKDARQKVKIKWKKHENAHVAVNWSILPSEKPEGAIERSAPGSPREPALMKMLSQRGDVEGVSGETMRL